MKTLKDYFDKIYVLNYIEAKERRENILKQLDYYNFREGVEFSYGMPFTKIRTMKPHFEEMAKLSNASSNIKTVACSFNHYSAIKTAYELGANSVLILEDDIIFRDNRDLIIEYLDNVPKDWDYLYFTPRLPLSNPNAKDYVYHDLILVKNSKDKWINLKEFNYGHDAMVLSITSFNGMFCSGAYALSRKAMKVYISMFENNNFICNSDMVEYFYNNFEQSPLNSYTTNCGLFSVNENINSVSYDNEKNKIIINEKNIWNSITHTTDINDENFKFKIMNEKTLIWDKNI